MPRPKDENGRVLPAAHKRIDGVERVEQAAVFTLSEDRRLCHLTMKRKLTIARKAIDVVVDGATEPKALFKKDPNNAGPPALAEGWSAVLAAVRARDEVKGEIAAIKARAA